MTNGLSFWPVKHLVSPSSNKEKHIFKLHLLSSDCCKTGIRLPPKFCSLRHIGDAFLWKANASTINLRIPWTGSQRDTSWSNPSMHHTFSKCCCPSVCQRALPTRVDNSALYRTTDSSWKTSGGLFQEAILLPHQVASVFLCPVPCYKRLLLERSAS